MKQLKLVIVTLFLIVAQSATAKAVKDLVPEIVEAAANPGVIEAVKAQNDQSLTLAKIQLMDGEWKSFKNNPNEFMKSFLSNPAAKILADIEHSKPYFVEFILTDNQGANVALTEITSDYWQGDEPKFKNAFANGKGKVYIARPQKDKSTGKVISQVSVPVLKDGKAIGTLTVGVHIDSIK